MKTTLIKKATVVNEDEQVVVIPPFKGVSAGRGMCKVT